MSEYDPSFETGLSTDLFGRGDAAAALRAVSSLPLQLRTHGLRQMMFVGALALTERDEMRASAARGLVRALSGFDEILAFMAEGGDREDVHPRIRPILKSVFSEHPSSIEIPRQQRTLAARLLEAHGAGQRVTAADYDNLMLHSYRTFHPEMMKLVPRMEEANLRARHALEAAAEVARKRALDARKRIDTIARTVRLISLNARVEAARAGSAGRAFGVIAEEIKALSEQTETVCGEMGDSVDEIMANFRVV